VSVTVTAGAGACLTVTPGTVSFGTLPFSTGPSGISEGNTEITVSFCGTANQNLHGSTTDATGPSGSWTPQPLITSLNPCTAPNRFYLWIFGFTNPALYMTGTPGPVLATVGGSPAVFPAPSDKVFRFGIYMPCTGSNGAGEAKSLTATFTAVTA
jgi:hypothetical protein